MPLGQAGEATQPLREGSQHCSKPPHPLYHTRLPKTQQKPGEWRLTNPWQRRCVPQTHALQGHHLYQSSFVPANAKLGLGKIRWRVKTRHRLIHSRALHQLCAGFWGIICFCSPTRNLPDPRTACCPSELLVGALAGLKHSNTCQNA